MKKGAYINKAEMDEVMLLSAAQQICERLYKGCFEKSWIPRLKCAAKYLDNILMDRLSAVEPEQQHNVGRRAKHIRVRVTSSDEVKKFSNEELDAAESYTLSKDVYYNLLEQALYNCNHCPQGEHVKGCAFRLMLHDIAVPPVRVDVKAGECEFRFDNEIRWNDSEGNRVER